MNWTMPGVLDIYSVGDGELLYQIINTIAMFNNLGTLKTLAMIGLMIGLLLGPLKYVVSGGKDVDIAGPFAAILLVVLFFGGRATVRIHDVSGANSGGAVPTYNVANVPAGLAITGWIVSGVGFKLAERYEQGFTYPSQQMTKSGFGRSAEMLASIRQARRCIGNSAVKDFCLSLVNYLRDCSTAAFVADPTRASKAMVAADPLDSTNGFGVDTGWISTQMVVGGTASTVTCSAALGSLRLRGQTQDGVLDGFAQGVVGLTVPQYADANAADRIGDAYNAISRSVTDAKQMMLAEMIRGTWAKAMVGNPNLTSDQELANVAMIEASEQQATQAALGDTVFRQFIQPLLAVIEGVLYVVAPFLAIALGLGRIGASFALKIVIFGLWSMTWMPMLSFINFFQLMMVERAVDAMTSANALSSYAGAQLVGEGVSRWVTVGSWMAAAVPALTYGLLSGSASGIMKMASGAAGGAQGKELSASPDLASQSAALQTSSLMSASPATGVTMTGASAGSLEFGQMASQTAESARTAMNAATTRWTDSQGKTVANALMSDAMHAGAATHRADQKSSASIAKGIEAINSHGYSFDANDRYGSSLALAASVGGGVKGEVDIAKLLGGVKGALGGIGKNAGGGAVGDAAKNEWLNNFGAALGLKFGAHASMEDKAFKVADALTSLGEKMQSGFSVNDSARGDVVSAATDMLEQTARISGTESNRVAGTSDYKKATDDLQQTSDQYRSAQQFQQTAGARQSMPLAEFAQRMAHNPDAGNAAVAAAIEHTPGGAQALRNQQEQLLASGYFGSDRNAAKFAAAGILLSAPPQGSDSAAIGDASSRAAALGQVLAMTGGLQMSSGFTQTNAMPENRTNTSGVEAGSAQGSVERASIGAKAGTEQETRSAIEGLKTEEGKRGASVEAGSSTPVNVGGVIGAEARAEGQTDSNGFATFGTTFQDGASVARTADSSNEEVLNRGDGVVNGQDAMRANNNAATLLGEHVGLKGGGFMKAIGRDHAFNKENPPAASDNPDLQSYIMQAGAGAFTGGREVSPRAAVVLGAMAAVNNGERLSEGQMDRVRQAWKSMDDNRESAAIRNLDETWYPGDKSATGGLPGDISLSDNKGYSESERQEFAVDATYGYGTFARMGSGR